MPDRCHGVLPLRCSVEGLVGAQPIGAIALAQAVGNAAQGKAYLPPLIVKRVLDGVAGALGSRGEMTEKSITPLSNRELSVVRLMAEGKRNREIAKDLSISERTVGNHITNIYNKLGIYDRSQAVVYAIKKGIVRI